MSRPSEYTQELAEIICAEVAEGKSMRSICAEAWAPSKTSIFRWLAERQEFRDQYARACEMRADAIFEEALAIADTPQEGRRVKEKPDGTTETVTHDMTEHRRLRVETRKWFLAKLMPKKYGDRLELGGNLNIKTHEQALDELDG